ncbi:hypothetical protein G4B88_001731 [Cannabis sativa]|uniref:DUF4283 domain-containing protein n=1 Tax=Cannabis sativa TaxID=3483 RepID=A0A7J6I1T9_CANSA|nr:hypothetical protein G4B88_001731 [Cannabis sativa]
MEPHYDDFSETIRLHPQELVVISATNSATESGPVVLPNIVYGKLLTDKPFNPQSCRNFFSGLWRKQPGITMEEATDGMFLITFQSEFVKQRIIRGQPWHFLGHYLSLVESSGINQVVVEDFKNISFWIQVHGIPIKNINETLGSKIGMIIGTFAEYDAENSRTFMRIRVLWDINRPLLRGMLFEGEDQLSNMWISFKYERLNTFCKFCGLLDHVHTECVALLEEIEAGTRPILQYDDKIKTTGLDHMFSPVRSSTTGGPIHKSVTQMAKDVALKKASNAVLGLTTKRQKIFISDQEQGTTYTQRAISKEEVSLLNQKPIDSNKSDYTNIAFIESGNAAEKTRNSELSKGKTIEVGANSGSKGKTKNSKA